MGRPKATLLFGSETMLARIVRLLGEAVDPVIVVTAADGKPPELPPGVAVVCDRHADRGPLEGLVRGLEALGDRAEGAFLTGCDVPLLRPEFVRRMIALSAGYDVAVPHVGGFDEPLAAVYHRGVLPYVEALLAAGQRRPVLLLEQVKARRVTADELIDVDPRLQSLANVNSPADYRAALASAGFEESPPGRP